MGGCACARARVCVCESECVCVCVCVRERARAQVNPSSPQTSCFCLCISGLANSVSPGSFPFQKWRMFTGNPACRLEDSRSTRVRQRQKLSPCRIATSSYFTLELIDDAVSPRGMRSCCACRSGEDGRQPSTFFFSSLILSSLELSDTQSLWDLNTSPPRNRCTFLCNPQPCTLHPAPCVLSHQF